MLTRLPSGLAVAPTLAVEVLSRRFSQPPLWLDDADRTGVLETLAAAGVFGGASYDGLVALEARAHGRTLLTVDERAQSTYRRLGAKFSVIAATDAAGAKTAIGSGAHLKTRGAGGQAG